MLPLIIAPQADADSDNFYLHIAQTSLGEANRFLASLQQTYQLLAEHPEIASKFPTSVPKLAGIRWFPVKGFPNHLIFYRHSKEQVEIIRLFHKAQDIVDVLEEGIK